MRELVRLRDRYPTLSRMTRWRWKHDPNFPKPVIVGGCELFVEAELTEFEEKHRAKPARAKPAREARDTAAGGSE